MLRLIFPFVLLFSFHLSFSQTPIFPDPADVLAAFFERYRAPDPVDLNMSLERRPDGYYIGRLKNGVDVEQSELFFDFAHNEFKELKAFQLRNSQQLSDAQLPVLEATAKERAESFLYKKAYLASELERQPYYGYAGWYHDVIKLYEGKSKLGDWELNALARAYQTAGSALFDNSSGYALKEDRLPLPMGPNAMTQAQVEQFLSIVNKELETYKRLIRQNPDYMTPVGPVTSKYGFEVMDAFLKLLIHQDEATAKSVIREDLFDPYLIQSSRNLLHSCPKDALLFVWGDGDTYPLYYLQAHEGFRTDVVVVNLSLIVLPRYLRLVLSGPLGAKPIKNKLPQQMLDHLVIFQNQNEQTIDSKPVDEAAFMELLRNPTLYESFSDYLFCKFSANEVMIQAPEDAPKLKENPVNHIAWNSNGGRIFYGQELLMMEALQTNNWQRPLCFSLTCPSHVWVLWSEYLALEGLVYRIYPNKLNVQTFTGDHLAFVNTSRFYRLYTETFAFDTTQLMTPNDKLPFYSVHYLTAFNLIRALGEEGQDVRAKQIARRLPLDLPDRIHPWDNSWIILVEWLGEHGELALGEKIALEIWNNYRTSKIKDDSNMQRSTAQVRLTNFARKYKLEALEAQLQKF